MKKLNRNFWNILLIVVMFAIVIIVVCSDSNFGTALEALKGMQWGWAGAALGFYLAFVAMDGISVMAFLKRQGYKVPFWYGMFVAVEGQFYSNVTPGASGGQPMQVYYLHKKGVPMGLATSSLVVRFFSFQFMLSVLAAIMWLRYPVFIEQSVGAYKWFMILGFVYNTTMVTLLVLFVLKRNWIRKALSLCIRLGTRLKLIKDPEKTRHKADILVDTFVDSLELLTRHPLDLVVQLIICAMQLLCQMTILYFIYLGLGLRTATWGQVVAVDIMEYISAAYMPLPGASGASEVTFSLYFGHLFQDDGLCFAALMLWRFFTYYFMLLSGMIVTMAYGWRVGEGSRAVLKSQPIHRQEWADSLEHQEQERQQQPTE